MDMLAFLYIASLFAIGGAAFSLMWKNISDIKEYLLFVYFLFCFVYLAGCVLV